MMISDSVVNAAVIIGGVSSIPIIVHSLTCSTLKCTFEHTIAMLVATACPLIMLWIKIRSEVIVEVKEYD